jgi:hypothetical protein
VCVCVFCACVCVNMCGVDMNMCKYKHVCVWTERVREREK